MLKDYWDKRWNKIGVKKKLNLRQKEAVEIVEDLEVAGFLTIPEIREMLIMGTKNRKTTSRIEEILGYIEKDRRYLKLKEKHLRRRRIELLSKESSCWYCG